MRNVLTIVLSLTFIFSLGRGADAEEHADSAAQAELMAKAMELAEPGKEHERLAKLAGNWTFETRMWMSPECEPMVVPGKAEGEMVLGGRFLHSEFTTESGYMDGGGLFILGFDRRYEKYTYVGFDTWGTYSVSASGTYDPNSNSITMYGEDHDPVLESTQKYDFVVTFLSDDQWKFEVIFYDAAHTGGADKFKMVEAVYSRAE